jgi:hypothetical protein
MFKPLKLLKYLYPEPEAALPGEIKKWLYFNAKRGTFFALIRQRGYFIEARCNFTGAIMTM